MARNVEFKARVPSLEGILSKAAALADGPTAVLHQVDTFFEARQGRVKLRRIWSAEGSAPVADSHQCRQPVSSAGSDPVVEPDSIAAPDSTAEPDSVELILYRREDEAGARLSQYQRLVPVAATTGDDARSTDTAAELTASLLSRALGVRGEVSKIRTLLLIGQTRVHLDEVAGLGEFVELEVVLKPDQSEEFGRKVAESLMFALGIDPAWIEPHAYIDLLEYPRP